MTAVLYLIGEFFVLINECDFTHRFSVPSSILLSEATVADIDNRTQSNGVRNCTINVTRNYFVENSPPVKAKSSLRATRVLHQSIFFTVNMAVEEITDDPGMHGFISILILPICLF